MKKLNTYLSILCVSLITLVFVSCQSGNDYRNMLPKESLMTMSFNPKSLAGKAKVGDFSESIFYKMIAESMADSDIDTDERTYLLSLIEQPMKSGLSTDHDGFIFMSVKSTEYSDPNIGVLLKVKDRKAVDKFVNHIMDESDFERVNEDGITIVGKMGDWETVVMAYNDDACLLYFAQEAYAKTLPEIKTLFTQKKENSLMSINHASAAFTGNNDMCMVMTMEQMINAMPSELKSIPGVETMAKAIYVMPCNFEKGKIVSDTKILFTDKEAEKQYLEIAKLNNKSSGNLARYTPGNSIMVINGGIKGAQIYEYIAAVPSYSMALGMMPQVKPILEAIEGDIMLCFTGMTPDGKFPKATIMAEVNDPTVIENVFSMIQGIDVTEITEGQYALAIPGGNIYLGIIDKMLYVTTSDETIAALNGGNITSMKDTYGKQFNGGYGTVIVDFRPLRTLIEGMIATGKISRREVPQMTIALQILGLFEDIQMTAPKFNDANILVNMTDKDRNAADVIYHTIENMVQALSNM